MPQETDRLKLPLPLGNENVTRESINGIFEKIDAGVATQADLDTLREAVSKMDIPDASLTQKGKVQLSSKTDGTSEAVAATEKSVRDARLAVLNDAESYVDAKTWQKHKLSGDNGRVQRLINGFDLNNLNYNGMFNCLGPMNGPLGNISTQWYYIEVMVHSDNVGYIVQRASRLDSITSPTFYMRICNNGTWGAWSIDLFQSVSDGKTAIAAAITDKGVAATGSDTFVQLGEKIRGIDVGKKYASGTANFSLTYSNQMTVQNLSFKPTIVVLKIGLTTSQYSDGSGSGYSTGNMAMIADGRSIQYEDLAISIRVDNVLFDGGFSLNSNILKKGSYYNSGVTVYGWIAIG
ncbi:pyocin knob domain-containing protein [Paenibacillus illinoisensis]|uniref:pyocin knob domain-containing protein n=1 Tax=Paenibacillus illinoisensis TaxID=59845 RepID=UPI00203B4CEA|nr:pyocin knob domain-containing protein [Paenibacillus illinoisensis]MCM3204404.1 pyocin knob domain-containing protein [Paenibacillus illinoisensis]